MATSAQCGYGGSISSGGEVTHWNFTEEVATPDATNMGTSAGYHEYISCLQSGSGDFDTQVACGSIGAVAGLSLTNTKVTYEMDAIITNITLAAPVDGKVMFRYSFVSTGEVSVS
jgi:hypothetical protein